MSMTAKLVLGLAASLGASQASAAAEFGTKLIDCAEGSCLVVTGSRQNVASAVVINGHDVRVEGSRKWRAVLPVETLREWSEPYARTITVSIVHPRTRIEASGQADLPIGLLGGGEKLSMLIVRVK